MAKKNDLGRRKRYHQWVLQEEKKYEEKKKLKQQRKLEVNSEIKNRSKTDDDIMMLSCLNKVTTASKKVGLKI